MPLAAPDENSQVIAFWTRLGLPGLVDVHTHFMPERMLAKVPGERYPDFRGREGETILISWKEEDVQLLHS